MNYRRNHLRIFGEGEWAEAGLREASLRAAGSSRLCKADRGTERQHGVGKRRTWLKIHLMPDHVHLLISIPPKYAVSQVVGYIKGKSAIHLARVYFVSTVGRDEVVIQRYIQDQEHEDKRLKVAQDSHGRVSNPVWTL